MRFVFLCFSLLLYVPFGELISSEMKIDITPFKERIRFSQTYTEDFGSSSPFSLEERIKNYVAAAIKTSPDLFQLILYKVIKNGEVTHNRYRIVINSRMIHNFSLSAHIQNNEILNINGRGIPSLNAFDFRKVSVLQSFETEEIVTDLFGLDNIEYFEQQEVYFFKDNELLLCYLVTLSDARLRTPAWQILINAIDGMIVEKLPLIQEVTGQGVVYPENKVKTPDLEQVPLDNLKEEQSLNGKFVQIINSDPHSQQAMAEDYNFIYREYETHFAEVSTYFYADTYLNWLANQLPDMELEIKIKVHVPDPVTLQAGNIAYYDFVANTISLGDGDGKFLQNLSIDSDVIMHEIGHYLVYTFGGITSIQGESGAIHEGIADFLAMHRSDDPCLGESVMVGKPCVRRADNNYIYPDSMSHDPHKSGEILSGTLWQIRSSLPQGDRETFASLVVRSLPFIGIKNALFEDAYHAMLKADSYLFDQKFYCSLTDHFKQRGFLFSYEDINKPFCPASPREESEPDNSINLVKESGSNKGKKSSNGCAINATVNTRTGSSGGVILLFLIFLAPILIRE